MSWIHIRDEIRTAIKKHRCRLCDLPINVGEKYLRRVGTQNDGIIAIPLHIKCETFTKNWNQFDWDINDPSDFRDHCFEEVTEMKTGVGM